MTKWALTVLLVLSAPIAFYAGFGAFEALNYLSQRWPDGKFLSGGEIWDLLLRLAPTFLWFSAAAWTIALWRRSKPVVRAQKLLTILFGGLLLTLTAITAFFAYVIWAWSQM